MCKSRLSFNELDDESLSRAQRDAELVRIVDAQSQPTVGCLDLSTAVDIARVGKRARCIGILGKPDSECATLTVSQVALL